MAQNQYNRAVLRIAPTFLRAARCAVALLLVLAAGCASQSQRLRYVTEPSRIMDAELTYGVYLPPGYDPEQRLPLVVFLHGGGDDAHVFDDYDVAEHLDAAIRAGRMPRAVIVLPRGDNGFWINWYDGSRRYEDWILHEIIPEVRQKYRTGPCPDDCHIMGASMGGYGALHLSLRHPGRFASTTVLSGPIFDLQRMTEFANSRLIATFVPVHRVFGPIEDRARISQHDPFRVWRKPDDLHGTRLLLAWGEQDRKGIRDTNRKFQRHLETHGIPHEARVFSGGHGWKSWRRVLPEVLAHQLGTHTESHASASP